MIQDGKKLLKQTIRFHGNLTIFLVLIIDRKPINNMDQTISKIWLVEVFDEKRFYVIYDQTYSVKSKAIFFNISASAEMTVIRFK